MNKTQIQYITVYTNIYHLCYAIPQLTMHHLIYCSPGSLFTSLTFIYVDRAPNPIATAIYICTNIYTHAQRLLIFRDFKILVVQPVWMQYQLYPSQSNCIVSMEGLSSCFQLKLDCQCNVTLQVMYIKKTFTCALWALAVA